MSLPANEAPGSRFQMSILAGIGQALQNSPIPGFLLDFASNDVSPVGRSFLGETSTPFASGGMRQVIPAMAKVMDWTQFYQASQVQEQAQRRLIVPTRHFSTPPGGSWSEHQARNFLQQESIPVIPAQLTTGGERGA